MLTTVTITGADDKTDPNDLIRLSVKYPFVEWGLLLSQSKMGQQRYPSLDWFEVISQIERGEMHRSLHVCGKITQDILYGQYTLIQHKEIKLINFQRMQLNFNIKNCDLDLVRFIRLYDELPVGLIFQYNKSNKELMDWFLKYGDSSWDYLYDSSGGRGTLASTWQPPLKYSGKDITLYTGYAGGLTPDNLDENLQVISGLCGDADYWIDVESGVRTDNEFDLDKVERFLETAKKYTI